MSISGEEVASELGATGSVSNPSMASGFYNLKKEDLATLLRRLNIDCIGTLDVLRRRLAGALQDPEDNTDRLDAPGPPLFAEPLPRRIEMNPANIQGETGINACESIRKWQLVYDGRTDAVSFLERIEELQECYRLTDAQLLLSLPVLLRGNALLWYRNSRTSWTTWHDFLDAFRRQYLPPQQQLQTEEDVRTRTQQENESFKDFAVALQTLLRRAGISSPAAVFDRMYRNMHPKYKIHIRRNSVSTMVELMDAASDLELAWEEQRKLSSTVSKPKPRETNSFSRPPPMKTTPAPETRQSPPPPFMAKIPIFTDTCWKCGRRGHTSKICRGPSILFCSRCGRRGIMSRSCPCPPGNRN